MIDSRADMVEAHENSVVLGGANVLFPVPESLTNGFARQIKLAISAAEDAAYARGRDNALRQVRMAIGVAK